jgi:PAS domain S-box-containing protein
MHASIPSLELPLLDEVIDRAPLLVSANTSVAEAIALMGQAKGSHCALPEATSSQAGSLHSSVLVMQGTQLIGLLTERDVVKLAASGTNVSYLTVAEIMTQPVITLTQSPTQNVLTALSVLRQHRIRHLPILNQSGELVGLVTPSQIRNRLQPFNLLKLRTVAEVVNRTVIHAPPTASVRSIAQQMANHQVSCVIIAEATATALHPVGIITERDVVQFQVLELNLAQITAQTVMSSPLFCLHPEDTLWVAQQDMQIRRIRRLIVTDAAGVLQGIVTQTNLLRVLDSVELLGIIEVLQQQVHQKVGELEDCNQKLRQEAHQKKQVEDALRQSYADLEKRVTERTNELTQANALLHSEIQQRRQTEQVLQETLRSLEFQKQALDQAAIVAITDRQGVITYVNDQFCRISQYAQAELIGQTHRIINSGYHPPEFFQNLWRDIAQGKVWTGEIKNKAKDGSYYWVATTIVPFFNEFGKIYQYLAIRFDITDRKLVEESLRQSEAQIQSILDNAKAVIYLKDTQSRYLLINREYETLFHLNRNDVRGKTDHDFFPQEIADTFRENDRKVLEAGVPLESEEIAPQDDGLHTYLSIKFPLKDAAGISYAVCGISTDITDRIRADAKIREQAELLNITSDAILVRDLKHRIHFWNQGAERLYGWQAEEALEQDARELLFAEASSELDIALNTVCTTGEWTGELHKVSKAGQELIVESRWTLVCNEAGQPSSILSVDTDITEKKRLEAQFLRAQRLESLGTLASGVAHDLNNILTPIVAVSQLLPLKLKGQDAQSQNLLQVLQDSAKRGTDLVKQILAFARGTDGQRTAIDIGHLLAEVGKVAEQTFPQNIDISIFAADPNLWPVAADATQLHQIFMNLLVNARDAMPAGGRLTVNAENLYIDETYTRVHIEAHVGSYVVITITDTGMGIPPAVINRIFEPFFTTKEPGKGTGLGLSTALGIIRSHGGFLNVYSEVNKGTCFKIYLPAEETLPSPVPETLEMLQGDGSCVLVVDDEASIRDITQTTLENYHYQVMTACNGVEAISLYAQHTEEIQVILLDLMMPTLDASTTIRTLQKINPDVKIMLMSGLDANAEVAQNSHLGIQAFIAKPFTVQDLLQTLRNILTPSSTNDVR